MLYHTVDVKSYVYAGPQPGFLQPTGTYPNHMLFGIEAGSMEFQVGEESGIAAFGDLLVCPAGTEFKRQALEEVVFHFIHFDLLDADEAAAPFPARKVAVSDVARLSSTYAYLGKTNVSRGMPAPITKLTNHLTADLLFLCELERLYEPKRKKSVDPIMQQAAGYIHRHLFSDINMHEIACKLGIRQPQLTRRFKDAYGAGPVEYMTRLRLEEAKRLLLETDDTLETIAERCGYESGSYFSRVFSAKVGLTPSTFRQNYRV